MTHAAAIRRPLKVKLFFIVSLFLIAGSLIFYIFQINNFFADSYSLQNYENNITSLNNENESLEGDLASIQTLSGVESEISSMQFENIGQVTYIQVSENPVAAAR